MKKNHGNPLRYHICISGIVVSNIFLNYSMEVPCRDILNFDRSVVSAILAPKKVNEKSIYHTGRRGEVILSGKISSIFELNLDLKLGLTKIRRFHCSSIFIRWDNFHDFLLGNSSPLSFSTCLFKRDPPPKKKQRFRNNSDIPESPPSTLSERSGRLRVWPWVLFLAAYKPCLFPHSELPQNHGLSAFVANFFKCSFSASAMLRLFLGLELSKGDQVTR